MASKRNKIGLTKNVGAVNRSSKSNLGNKLNISHKNNYSSNIPVSSNNFSKKSSKQICIGYVNPTILVKRPVCEISARMADSGFKTTVFFPKKLFKGADSSLHHNILLKKSVIKNYSTLNIPFINSEQPVPITPCFFTGVFKLFKENDIVHMWVPYYISSWKILLIKRIFFPKKILILTMDTVPGYSFSMGKFMDALFRCYDRIFRGLLFNTPNVITLYGESLVPFALEAGMPEHKLRVLSTGISMKVIDEGLRKDVRQEFNVDSKTKIVLFAGLMVPRKGVEKIIKIANDLKRENVLFILAGDGPEKDEYISQAKKMGLSKKMIFLGWRKDMPRLYQGSDILVLPAEGEGLPGVVMEAMSYGVPCVTSDIPCIPDLIENGVDGFLCNKDASESFSKKIKLLVRDDSLRKKMGHSSFLKMKKFDWDVVIKKYDKLYRDLTVKNG